MTVLGRAWGPPEGNTSLRQFQSPTRSSEELLCGLCSAKLGRRSSRALGGCLQPCVLPQVGHGSEPGWWPREGVLARWGCALLQTCYRFFGREGRGDEIVCLVLVPPWVVKAEGSARRQCPCQGYLGVPCATTGELCCRAGGHVLRTLCAMTWLQGARAESSRFIGRGAPPPAPQFGLCPDCRRTAPEGAGFSCSKGFARGQRPGLHLMSQSWEKKMLALYKPLL